MYNTTNYKEITSLLSQTEELVKILLEQSTFPAMVEDFVELKDKLSAAQVSTLTTDIISSPSGKELRLREIASTLVNSYTYSEASNIKDLFYKVDGTNLRVGMISNRPGYLIGKGGQAFNRALDELKKEFVNENWGFTDLKLEIIENKFNFSDYHFESINY